MEDRQTNDLDNDGNTIERAEKDPIERSENESIDDYYRRLGERSDREDLVMFINACFAATRQNEYYTDRFEQSISIDFLHRYVMTNYRRIYARAIASGINHFNQAQIVGNLLASGAPADPEQRTEEGQLIELALRRLPPNRVYGLFQNLQARRVNNRRTRAVIKRYLDWRKEPEFDAVKYSRKYRAASAHAHLKLDDEFGKFLFELKRTKTFKTSLFDKVKRAHFSQSAIYELPFTVAESFAAKHKVPRDTFFQKIKHKMTAAEKLRFQSTVAKTKGAKSLDFDLGRASLTRLAIYVLSLPVPERIKRADEFVAAFESATSRAKNRAPVQFGRVAAVLDRSVSSMGSREKRNRPLAVALATSHLLKAAAQEYRAIWTLPIEYEYEFAVEPQGQTCLAEPLIEALKWKPDLLLIVSDGYENDPPGVADQIIRVYREKIANSTDSKSLPEVIHLNPVFDSNHYSPKPLGELIATVGIRDAEDVATMLGFARYASGSAKLEALEGHLASLANALLDAGRGGKSSS